MQTLALLGSGADLVAGTMSYTYIWNVPDWKKVRTDPKQVNDQKAAFQTVHSYMANGVPWGIRTEWRVGFKDVPGHPEFDHKLTTIYWTLLNVRGATTTDKPLQVHVKTIPWSRDGSAKVGEKDVELLPGDIIDATDTLALTIVETVGDTDTVDATVGDTETVDANATVGGTDTVDANATVADTDTVDATYIKDDGSVEYQFTLTFHGDASVTGPMSELTLGLANRSVS